MIIAVVAILFIATLVRSTLGFGEALIAVPLLALFIPVTVAAPVAALVSITVAAIVVARDWRHVQMKSAAWLIGSTAIGIPLGLLLLTRVAEPAVKAVLALVIILFSAQSLARRTWRLSTDRHAWMFGLVAGVLGGAYGMNGPPLAVYGSLREWTPAQFRATLQGYFLPASALGMLGYAVAGLWTAPVTRLYLTSLPAVLVAILAGQQLSRRMTAGPFARAVYAGLAVTGIILLIQSMTVL